MPDDGGPRLLSLNVAMPARLPGIPGPPLVTGIAKRPTRARLRVHALGLEGDGVGNPAVHGGPSKAVYAYPAEHLPYWHRVRPTLEVGPGYFGENLTVRGVPESSVRPGDRLRIGSAAFVVTQPRFPCGTLARRVGDPGFVGEFQRAGRSGFYLGVAVPGELAAGDGISVEPGGGDGPTIAELFAARGR